jgi:poly(hydroxyalkanoate) granule-associated protein
MAKLKSNAKARGPGSPRSGASKPSDAGVQQKAEQLSRSIMDSAQHIWLAGMGAFNRAQAEGTKMFEGLVSEGMTLEARTRKLATGRVDAVRDAMESKVGQVKGRATDTWDRLEKVFEDRVQRALVRLGVPGRDDLKALIERVDRLNAELRKLSAKPASKPASSKKTAATARKPASRKTASQAAGKKAASKAGVPAQGNRARKAPAKGAARKSAAAVKANAAPLQDATE